MSPSGEDPADRRRRRRRFAAVWGALAIVLLISGVVLVGREGVVNDVGEGAIGLGIGIGVAAAFLALGFDPGTRR